MILSLQNITKKFGGHTVLENLSIQVEKGDIHGIIGPNGSGKTTLFNVISGIYKPDSGRIFCDGVDITDMPAHRIPQQGIARTFQLLRVFPSLTVIENLMLAMTIKEKTNLLDDLLCSPRMRQEKLRMEEKAHDVLKMIGLERKAYNSTEGISIGQRRMLQLGQAIISEPKLLLLDECVAGLDPANVDKLVSLLHVFRRDMGITILMIEHIMDVVMQVCDRITALDYGEMIFEGTPEEAAKDSAVIEAYLGRV